MGNAISLVSLIGCIIFAAGSIYEAHRAEKAAQRARAALERTREATSCWTRSRRG